MDLWGAVMGYERPFISRAVVKRNGLESGEKLLLVVLRAYQDPKTGVCAPTKLQLQSACAASERTIRVWMSGLEAKGMVQSHHTPNRCAYTFLPLQKLRGKLPL